MTAKNRYWSQNWIMKEIQRFEKMRKERMPRGGLHAQLNRQASSKKRTSDADGDDYDETMVDDEYNAEPQFDDNCNVRDDGEDSIQSLNYRFNGSQIAHFKHLISPDIVFNRLLESTLFNHIAKSGKQQGDKNDQTQHQQQLPKTTLPSLSSIPFPTQTDSLNGILNIYLNPTRHMQYQALWLNNQLLIQTYNLSYSLRASGPAAHLTPPAILQTALLSQGKPLIDHPIKSDSKFSAILKTIAEKSKKNEQNVLHGGGLGQNMFQSSRGSTRPVGNPSAISGGFGGLVRGAMNGIMGMMDYASPNDNRYDNNDNDDDDDYQRSNFDDMTTNGPRRRHNNDANEQQHANGNKKPKK